ncbi:MULTISPECIES: DUF2617 family protein [Mycobacterium]|uniref:DUF2617 family protein n=1 Tax=Mycobacterium kiyosense TaxID=2871094 RepID=A0A9P3V125_9MYCO|nr:MULTISPECIES: DUF2617 family protein [Mycobacterium]BDB43229.1 hypothetical protein IWGMT90018_36750 [Mycobacterium kiyosense]BDE13570.1 hypothetical protein MKCMC460_24300 [Mycobacterium sp. 20KCMC460]GLB83376.1 hypothetical protein SRL2020028_26320 [Mycobacterium kiyosense]GLB93018.1 hypothetical protein SRL2020130_58350 [Mycobacterium kiyosense]GLB99122.1 hypothetical protein SRL2020226_58980 [Mycobacterium kiyosense]
MPLHQLAVTPADVSGARLALALNGPPPQPLATSRLAHPGGSTLLLGVLGASHVVTVEHGSRRFSEQVSCAVDGDLPGQSEAPGYILESLTEAHSEGTFRALAKELRDRCAHETGWLGGVFPGDDAALTALTAEPDGPGWRWQTWHLYPRRSAGGGTVVHTVSRWQP